MTSRPSQSIFPSNLSATNRQNKENQPLTYISKTHIIEPLPTSQHFGSDSVAGLMTPSGKSKLIATEDSTRRMASGPCKFITSMGIHKVPCPCVRGIFEANGETTSVEATCAGCGHALIHHESVKLSNFNKSFCDYSHRTQLFITSDKIICLNMISRSKSCPDSSRC